MSRRGWLLFAAMGVIWGIPYLLIKVADGGVSVPVLVCTRVALGSLLLLPAAVRGGHLAALNGHLRWLAAFTVVEIVGPFALLSNAERHLPSSTSGLLVAAVPIFSALLALATRSGDRLTLVRWAGLAVGLGGVALLAGPGAGHGSTLPVLEVLGTALGYSIGPVIANRKLSSLPPVAVNTVCLGLAAVIYAPFAALTWPHQVPSVQVLLALAALGVICTAAAFLVFFRLIAEVGPARATVITYVNPAVAVALGVIVLGEHLTAAIGVSFLLILGGSVLATRPGSARGNPAPPLPPDPAVVQDGVTKIRSE
ncbi:MAG TPA: EamA family transporter [Streptosporangiaceae bacterium]|nr:EamA family transporter [Streptosporangiaceae bacterium]